MTTGVTGDCDEYLKLRPDRYPFLLQMVDFPLK